MKLIQEQQQKNSQRGQSFQGVPMVASSPVRHEGNIQANPVEVTSYQQQPPAWQALSDFALKSDIEQPAFQQLVNFSEQNPQGPPNHEDALTPPPEESLSSMEGNPPQTISAGSD